MKILHFLFRDFWRKLVAVAFAAGIYYSVKPSDKASEIQSISRVCQVEILDLGTDRCVVFPDGFNPEVKALFSGTKKALDGIKAEDVIFYVVAAKNLTPGDHTLPVRCYSCRSDIEVHPIRPVRMTVSVIEIPVENHKMNKI